MESKKRLDIITDIETLGTSVDCTQSRTPVTLVVG